MRPDPVSMNWEARIPALERRVFQVADTATASAYAQGVQDAFSHLRLELDSLFERLSNEPIPARTDGEAHADQ